MDGERSQVNKTSCDTRNFSLCSCSPPPGLPSGRRGADHGRVAERMFTEQAARLKTDDRIAMYGTMIQSQARESALSESPRRLLHPENARDHRFQLSRSRRADSSTTSSPPIARTTKPCACAAKSSWSGITSNKSPSIRAS